MPASTPQGLPYPLPTEPVAEGAQAIRNLAEAIKGWQCLAELDLTAATTFNAIDQDFDQLRLIASVRSATAIKAEGLNLRCNGITSAAYFQSFVMANNNVVTANQQVAVAQIQIGLLPGSSATPSWFGTTDILFPSYNGPQQSKTCTFSSYCHAPVANNATDLWTIYGHGTFNPGAITPITSLTLIPGASAAFAAGSRAWLYGISGF